jgi:hypothetical protein
VEKGVQVAKKEYASLLMITRAVFLVQLVCTEDTIPPQEGRREVIGEPHVVEVVVYSATAEGYNML